MELFSQQFPLDLPQRRQKEQAIESSCAKNCTTSLWWKEMGLDLGLNRHHLRNSQKPCSHLHLCISVTAWVQQVLWNSTPRNCSRQGSKPPAGLRYLGKTKKMRQLGMSKNGDYQTSFETGKRGDRTPSDEWQSWSEITKWVPSLPASEPAKSICK